MEGMAVRCPHCDVKYRTHAAGDVEVCDFCDESFRRYANAVGDE